MIVLKFFCRVKIKWIKIYFGRNGVEFMHLGRIYDHFYKISDKVVCPSRKAIEKKHTYVGLDIFKKLERKRKNKNSKILVNFHEFSKLYLGRLLQILHFQRK